LSSPPLRPDTVLKVLPTLLERQPLAVLQGTPQRFKRTRNLLTSVLMKAHISHGCSELLEEHVLIIGVSRRGWGRGPWTVFSAVAIAVSSSSGVRSLCRHLIKFLQRRIVVGKDVTACRWDARLSLPCSVCMRLLCVEQRFCCAHGFHHGTLIRVSVHICCR